MPTQPIPLSTPLGPSQESSEIPRLGIQFCKYAEQYSHQVLLCCGKHTRSLLRSVDDTASPPIQEWVAEDRDGQKVLLTVGQAGRNHWSGAIQPTREPTGLAFELACRLNQPWPQVGSGYLLNADCQVNQATAEQLGWRFEGRQYTLTVDPHCRLHWREASRLIRIDAPGRPDALPHTRVWSYRLTVTRGRTGSLAGNPE